MPPPVLQVYIIFLMYLYQLRDSTANLQRCLQMSIHILKCLHIIYILQLFISHIVLSRYTKTIPKCIMYTGICMQPPLVNILYTVYYNYIGKCLSDNPDYEAFPHPRKCVFTTTLATKIIYLRTLK